MIQFLLSNKKVINNKNKKETYHKTQGLYTKKLRNTLI